MKEIISVAIEGRKKAANSNIEGSGILILDIKLCDCLYTTTYIIIIQKVCIFTGIFMRDEDEVKGKAKKTVGKVREEIGDVTGNKDQEMKGKREQVEGHVQEKVGKAKRKIDEE